MKERRIKGWFFIGVLICMYLISWDVPIKAENVLVQAERSVSENGTNTEILAVGDTKYISEYTEYSFTPSVSGAYSVHMEGEGDFSVRVFYKPIDMELTGTYDDFFSEYDENTEKHSLNVDYAFYFEGEKEYTIIFDIYQNPENKQISISMNQSDMAGKYQDMIWSAYQGETEKYVKIVSYEGNATELTIPGTINNMPVREIQGYAFDYSTSLEKVIVSENITTFDNYPFQGCLNLKRVELPSTLVNVFEQNIFENCPIESITFPNGSSCLKFEDKVLYMNNALIGYYGGDAEKYVISDGVESIASYSFYGYQIKTIYVPKSVEYISSHSLGYMEELKECYIENSNCRFDLAAEHNVGSFYSVWDEIKGKSIYNVKIHGKSGGLLEELCVNAGITFIPIVSTPETVGTTMKSSEITSTTGVVPANSSFTVTSSDPNNPTVAFNGVDDENAAAVTIPETITYDGVTYRVTTVSIDDYTSKKDEAKYEVTGNKVGNLTSEYKAPTNKKKKTAKIPKYSTYKGVKFKVTSVASKAFKGNKKLKNISIATSITKIGNDAFNGCTNLKTVTIGKSLKTIGKNAFKNCKKLTKITIKSKRLKLVGKNALKGINKNCKIKVPAAKVKAYKKLFKNKGLKKVKVTK